MRGWGSWRGHWGEARHSRLHLSDCRIGDEGAALLAGALAGCKWMTHLDLQWSRIGDVGEKALGECTSRSCTRQVSRCSHAMRMGRARRRARTEGHVSECDGDSAGVSEEG
eukprot:3935863-Rhodomonas_salina.1